MKGSLELLIATARLSSAMEGPRKRLPRRRSKRVQAMLRELWLQHCEESAENEDAYYDSLAEKYGY